MKKTKYIMRRLLATGLAAVLLTGSVPGAVYAENIIDSDAIALVEEGTVGSGVSSSGEVLCDDGAGMILEDEEASLAEDLRDQASGEESLITEAGDVPDDQENALLVSEDDPLAAEGSDVSQDNESTESVPADKDTATGTALYTALIPTGRETDEELASKQVTFGGKKWYVIEDNSIETGESKGTLTLLAVDTFGSSVYNTEFDYYSAGNHYSKSVMKNVLDALTEEGGALADVAHAIKTIDLETKDDYDGNRYDLAENVKCYILDKAAVEKLPANVKKCTDPWWVRWSYFQYYANQGLVDRFSDENPEWTVKRTPSNETHAYRPALQLKLANVIYKPDSKEFTPKAYSHLLNNSTSTVKFNGMDWYLIKDDSTAEDKGTVTLLAKNYIGKSKFGDSSKYEGSTIQGYLNKYYADKFANVDSAVVDGKLFLLSAEEAQAIHDDNLDVLKCEAVEGIEIYNLNWWLRTPSKISSSADSIVAAVCGANGEVDTIGLDTVFGACGVRPALQLNLPSVTFTPGTRRFTLNGEVHSISLTGGAHATVSGGSIRQIGLTGSMEPVIYTADTNYEFEDFADIIHDGITIAKTGNKEVTVSGMPTVNVKLTVPDAVLKITEPTAKDLTFNGRKQELVNAGGSALGEMQYAFGDESEATGAYSASIPAQINSGTYHIWYKVVGADDNGDTAPRTLSSNIAKAPLDDPEAITRTYGFKESVKDSVDLSSLVPENSGEVTFKELSYGSGAISYKEAPSVSGNTLSYTLKTNDGPESDTITVKAQMQNYEDVTLTVKIEQIALSLYEKTGKTQYELRTAKTLNQGQSFTLVPRFDDGTENKRVVWSSSNPDAATVTQDGKVTARSAGKTTITAVSEGKSGLEAFCQVTVREPVSGLSLNRKSYTYGTGENVTLTATILPFTASQDIKWSTSDKSVVIVCDGDGHELNGTETGKGKIYDVSKAHTVTIKAAGRGKASVTALAADGSGKKAVCKFTVGNPVPTFEITGKGGNTSLIAGKTLAMTAYWGSKSNKPANTGLTWSVVRASDGGDASAIAAISSKGVLTGITAGNVRVTATSVADQTKHASVDITVNKPAVSTKAPKVTGISLSNKATLSDNGLYTGKSYSLKTKLTLSAKGKAASNAVAWISSNPAVATVSQKGVVKAVAPGRVTVTAVTRDTTDPSTAPSDSVTFNVYAKVSSVKIDKTKLTLGTQAGTQYGRISIVSIAPDNARDKSIKWTPANKNVSLAAIDAGEYPSVAEFGEPGEGLTLKDGQALAVKGVAPGTVKLTGITNDGSKKKVTCKVTVRGHVTGLALKTSTGKKGVNNVTLSGNTVLSDNNIYKGTMKAKSSMKLTPLVDINNLKAASTAKADKKLYKTYKKFTDTSVSYRSSNTSIATVDKKGKISVKKGVKSGSAVKIFVTSADGMKHAEFWITVK